MIKTSSNTSWRATVRPWIALILLSVGTSACAADKVSGPDASHAGQVTLSAAGPTTLASLGDTIVITSSVRSVAGQPVDATGLALRLSATGILENLGNGRFRAVGNGQVTVRTSVDTARSGVVPTGYYVEGVADSLVVTVRQIAVSLVIQPADSMFRAVGELRPLQFRLADARGNALVGGAPPVAFAAADSTVLRVDGSGVLKSIKDGTTQVIARSGALIASRTFTVNATRQHTSCMTYTRRRQSQTSCASVDFVVRYAREVTP